MRSRFGVAAAGVLGALLAEEFVLGVSEGSVCAALEGSAWAALEGSTAAGAPA